MKVSKFYLYEALQSPYFIPICLLLAVLIRLTFIYLIPYELTEDALWYYKRGTELAAGQGYLNTDGQPTAFWPVGYPALLGGSFMLFGASVRTGQWLNLGLYIGVIICAYYICRELFQSEIISRIVVLLLAFYPHHIIFTTLLLTEIFFTFLVMLGSLILVKQLKKGASITLYLAGLVFGAAILTKPQVILLPFLIIFAHGSMERRAKLALSTLLIFLGIITALIPWTVRNYQLFHTFIFVSTNGGINLLIGNHPQANGRYMWDEYLDNVWKHSSNEQTRDLQARQLAIHYIVEHPLRTLQLLPLKLFYLYRFDTQGIDLILAGVKNEATNIRQLLWAMKFVCQAYYMAVMACFILAIITFFQTGAQPWSKIGLGVILYFTCIYLPFFAEGRYQIQTMPWVVMYAAIPLAGWLTTTHRTVLHPQFA